jgi:hypothetical protein
MTSGHWHASPVPPTVRGDRLTPFPPPGHSDRSGHRRAPPGPGVHSGMVILVKKRIVRNDPQAPDGCGRVTILIIKDEGATDAAGAPDDSQ